MRKIVLNLVLFVILSGVLVGMLFYKSDVATQPYLKNAPLYANFVQLKQKLSATMSSISAEQSRVDTTLVDIKNLSSQPMPKKYVKSELNWDLNIPNLLVYLDKCSDKADVEIELHYTTPKDTVIGFGDKSKLVVPSVVDPSAPVDPNAVTPPADPNAPVDPNAVAPAVPTAPVDPNAPIDPNAPMSETVAGFSSYMLPITVKGTYAAISKFFDEVTSSALVLPYQVRIAYDSDSITEGESDLDASILDELGLEDIDFSEYEIGTVRAEIVLRILYVK